MFPKGNVASRQPHPHTQSDNRVDGLQEDKYLFDRNTLYFLDVMHRVDQKLEGLFVQESAIPQLILRKIAVKLHTRGKIKSGVNVNFLTKIENAFMIHDY